jgi:hypothetical protein
MTSPAAAARLSGGGRRSPCLPRAPAQLAAAVARLVRGDLARGQRPFELELIDPARSSDPADTFAMLLSELSTALTDLNRRSAEEPLKAALGRDRGSSTWGKPAPSPHRGADTGRTLSWQAIAAAGEAPGRRLAGRPRGAAARRRRRPVLGRDQDRSWARLRVWPGTRPGLRHRAGKSHHHRQVRRRQNRRSLPLADRPVPGLSRSSPGRGRCLRRRRRWR